MAEGGSPAPANNSQLHRENVTTANKHKRKQRGDFTAGILPEPSMRHCTRIRSRKAGDVFIRETKCFKSRRCETRAVLQTSCRQKYSILADYPSCFFVFFR